jgi:hypothetical protein
VTRPAPFGVQKFTWNPQTNAFEKAWLNHKARQNYLGHRRFW